MKPIHVVFSILVVAIFGFGVTGHAQTATITYTYDDLNRVTNASSYPSMGFTYTKDTA